jgi:predicted DNA-binding WGR domain protein
MRGRRFELEEGTSSKFWAIEREGRTVTVTFGRIGSTGQEKTKSFPDEEKAAHEEEKLVAEKIGKGYHEIAAGRSGNQGDEDVEDEGDDEDDGEPIPPPKGVSKPTTWDAIAKAWSAARPKGNRRSSGDAKAVAKTLRIARLPPSYLEYLTRFGPLGELELRYEREDFPNHLNVFPPGELLRQRDAHGKALDVFFADPSPEGQKLSKVGRKLLPFGYDTSRTVICWDPSRATPNGELAISFFNYELARHTKLGTDLKEVVKYYRPGSLNR